MNMRSTGVIEAFICSSMSAGGERNSQPCAKGHYARGEAAAVDQSVREVTAVDPRDIRMFARDYASAFGRQ
jgi:hypothetical protein